MNDVEPKRKWRKDLAFMIALVALLLAITIAALAVSSAAGQTIERNARNRDSATIEELQATIAELRITQTANVGVTECARKLNAAYVIADNNARHLWNTFVTDPNLDREKAKKDLADADAVQFAAAKAVDAFAHLPFLPCPTP